MRRIRLTGCVLVALAPAAHAQSPTPGGMPPGPSLADFAAMRFPQPVRAGDLVGRAVLRPAENQERLGTVRSLVRDAHGTVDVVIDFGGVLGFGARAVAVPIDAVVLVGDVVEVAAFTPEQLRGFPIFTPDGTIPVAPDTILKVGLAKPSH